MENWTELSLRVVTILSVEILLIGLSCVLLILFYGQVRYAQGVATGYDRGLEAERDVYSDASILNANGRRRPAADFWDKIFTGELSQNELDQY